MDKQHMRLLIAKTTLTYKCNGLMFCLSFKYIVYARLICMFYCHWIVNVRKTASVCGRVKTRTTATRTSITSVGRCCVRSVSWLRTTGKTSISWWVAATVCIYQLCSYFIRPRPFQLLIQEFCIMLLIPFLLLIPRTVGFWDVLCYCIWFKLAKWP